MNDLCMGLQGMCNWVTIRQICSDGTVAKIKQNFRKFHHLKVLKLSIHSNSSNYRENLLKKGLKN